MRVFGGDFVLAVPRLKVGCLVVGSMVVGICCGGVIRT